MHYTIIVYTVLHNFAFTRFPGLWLPAVLRQKDKIWWKHQKQKGQNTR